ncbi:Xylosidase/arabinosidase [bioreactor metagenome]|uniref:Xylosidase/arabinosidase n=1 Tax=bioreactor metagenome TaxID=1076179 RepID=A0A644WNT7_9ZZZZ
MKQQAFNPFLPSNEYIPDGEPHVFGDRAYLYGSHDRFGGKLFCLNDYVCWSAPVDDLSSWRCEGVIYRKSDDPKNSKGKRPLYAPDVQRGRDGRYYLYYSVMLSGIISVAVSDSPAGPFSFYGFVKYPNGHVIGTKRGDLFQFDPGVLVDDDGRVYLYSGNGLRKMLGKTGNAVHNFFRLADGGYCMELEPDMITVKTAPSKLFPQYGDNVCSFAGHEFFEASSIRKANGRYYFIYSSYHSHELCYALSDRPDGGFRFGGTLISNGDVFLNGRMEKDALNYMGNNHGSIESIGGRWYVFYHRQTNRSHFARQACAEEIVLLPDGLIRQAEMTSCGLNGGPLADTGTYPARIACNLFSKDGAVVYSPRQNDLPGHPYFTQDQPDGEPGEQYIAGMTDGATAGFKYFRFSQPREVCVTVRGNGSGKLLVKTEPHGAAVSEIEIEAGGQYGAFSARLDAEPGVRALYFTFAGMGTIDFLDFSLR